jgi:hypothetical protein
MLILPALAGLRLTATAADSCPTDANEISTDRPDITNSSLVVPRDSIQAKNGLDWSQDGSDALDSTNTRLRFGFASCTEFLVDIPSYFAPLNGTQPSGFSNLVVSLRHELPVPFGFGLSAAGGVGFPTGAQKIPGAAISVPSVSLVTRPGSELGTSGNVYAVLVAERLLTKPGLPTHAVAGKRQ